MGKKGMQDFIGLLKETGSLYEIEGFTNPELEITEIADRISKDPNGGKALLFKNTGTAFPVLINAFGSRKRMELVFKGKKPDQLAQEMQDLVRMVTQSPTGLAQKIAQLPKFGKLAKLGPKKISGTGSCQEVIKDANQLNTLPVLKCWPADGGRFITLPLVHTADPHTGIRNVGMYRMQVLDQQSTGMHWHMHKTGAKHYRAYKELKEKMPIAVVLGGDPVYTYCATAPLPDGIDEYLLAGFLRQKRVRLVKCLTQDVWVPEDADIVLEGYVDPMEELTLEGPFGDHTGFYSLADYYPKFHLTAITHKKDAVYPATIVGIPPQEDAWIAEATEKVFLEPIRLTMIPELYNMHLPVPGVAHNIALFSIDASYPGQGAKVLHTVWGAGQMMFTKYAAVFDQDIQLHDYLSIGQLFTRKVDPAKHLIQSEGPLDILDHASDHFALGGKLGFDVTGLDLNHLLPDEADVAFELQQIISRNPAIQSFRTDLLTKGISLVSCFINKNEAKFPSFLLSEITTSNLLRQVKFWLLVDQDLSELDWFYLFWVLGSHSDPSRDLYVWKPDLNSNTSGVLVIDATRKSKAIDGFSRDWPNPVLMSDEMIDLVDQKWDAYRIGPFRPSTSLKFRALKRGSGAVSDQ